MSQGKDYLHSHSGLERELKLPKHFVLVDEKYEYMFDKNRVSEFRVNHEGRIATYLKVSILDFVQNNGVFKNLMA